MTGRSVTLAITGMHCAACAQSIEEALRRTPGVIEADVNFAAETARVPMTSSGEESLVLLMPRRDYVCSRRRGAILVQFGTESSSELLQSRVVLAK